MRRARGPRPGRRRRRGATRSRAARAAAGAGWRWSGGASGSRDPRAFRGTGSGDWVVAAGVPRTAARDALRAHPAPPEQPVLLDRLLGVARAARVVAAARRRPGENDPVEPDQSDTDGLHDPPRP